MVSTAGLGVTWAVSDADQASRSDLLVPAPTSIMIFGQLTSVAQIANTKVRKVT